MYGYEVNPPDVFGSRFNTFFGFLSPANRDARAITGFDNGLVPGHASLHATAAAPQARGGASGSTSSSTATARRGHVDVAVRVADLAFGHHVGTSPLTPTIPHHERVLRSFSRRLGASNSSDTFAAGGVSASLPSAARGDAATGPTNSAPAPHVGRLIHAVVDALEGKRCRAPETGVAASETTATAFAWPPLFEVRGAIHN